MAGAFSHQRLDDTPSARKVLGGGEELNNPNAPIWWRLTPLHFLALLTYMNWLNYADRGALSGTVPDMDEFDMNDIDKAMLSGAFTVGFMLTSPIFGNMASYFKPFRLIGGGLAMWTVATLATSQAKSYGVLLVSRCFVGIGEASFVAIAPTFIDDYAPQTSRAKWLAVFFAAIPLGYASGYLYGGLIADHGGGWRNVFLIEVFAMAPCAVLCFLVTLELRGVQTPASTPSGSQLGELELASADIGNPQPRAAPRPHSGTITFKSNTPAHSSGGTVGSHSSTLDQTHVTRASASSSLTRMDGDRSATLLGEQPLSKTEHLKEQILGLWRSPVYVYNVLGYASFNFVIGCFAFFGPTYVHEDLGVKLALGDAIFGGMTAFTGLVGTWFGGYLMDRLAVGDSEEERSELAMKVCFYFTLGAVPISFIAFISLNTVFFFICLGLAELLLFCTTSPVNSAILTSVPVSLRPFAMATNTLIIHLLGDFPSPIVFGGLSNVMTHRAAMLVISAWSFWTILAWFIGWKRAEQISDRVRKQSSFVA